METDDPESEVDTVNDGCLHIRGGGPTTNNCNAMTPPIVPIHNNKRKRTPTLCISKNSIVFDLVRDIQTAADNCFAPPPGTEIDPAHPPQKPIAIYPGSIDELLEWGKHNVAPRQTAYGSMRVDDFNDDSLKFVLAGAIRPGDIIEKVEHTIPTSPSKVVAKKALQVISKNYAALKKKKCCIPYFRSDHYRSVYFENKSCGAQELTKILCNPKFYPLYLTFRRMVCVESKIIPHASTTANIDDENFCNPPMQKRLKKSELNTDSKVVPPAKDNLNGVKRKQQDEEVICLLDSSGDEDDDEYNSTGESTKDGTNKNDIINAIAMEADSACSDSKQSSQSLSVQNDVEPSLPASLTYFHHKAVPPDPTVPLHDDDFVLTPFGPGKILSWRVERHASANLNAEGQLDATIYNPVLIYSIDLHYGTCHIPANQVKTISGTPYTEQTLLTYHRVPLTEMDLLRLRPMTYLNDSIVNFYLKYLKLQFDRNNEQKKITIADDSNDGKEQSAALERPIPNINDTRGWDDLDGEGIHIFPSFLYTRMVNIFESTPTGNRNNRTNRQRLWSSLKSWTKGVDIFKKKLLVFPINESLHWTCVFVFHPGRLVRRYSRVCKEKTGQLVPLGGPKKEKVTSNGTTSNSQTLHKPVPMGQIPSTSANDSTRGAEIGIFVSNPSLTNNDLANSNLNEPGTICGQQTSAGNSTGKTEISMDHQTKKRLRPSDDLSDHGEIQCTKVGAPRDETCGKTITSLSSVLAHEGTMDEKALREKKDSLLTNGHSQHPHPPPDKNDYVGDKVLYVKSSSQTTGENLKDSETDTTKLPSSPSAIRPTEDANEISAIYNNVVMPVKDATSDGIAMVAAADVKQSHQAECLSKQALPKPHKDCAWQCDYCGDKMYDTYEEADAHEKVCEKNVDWCMVHFDSGKHFKLHKTPQICANIRKYLTSYYEGEYSSSHYGLAAFTPSNMPSFSAPVPVQDNTKDCGVYMLQIIENMLSDPPLVDYDFVRKKGLGQTSFGKNMFCKEVIERKRDDIMQLVHTLRLSQTKE